MDTDQIIPDDKDWTWVLDRPCPECHFDVSALQPTEVAGLIRTNAAEWAALMDRHAGDVRQRQRPDRWSVLEYAAHVRDVYRIFLERLVLMLETDDPLFANWDQDDTAETDGYAQQDPTTVTVELVDAAQRLADAFGAVESGQWERPGRRSDGAAFTIETFARYLVHDPVHHLWDVSNLATTPH